MLTANRYSPRPSYSRRKRGYTMIELVVAAGASTVLMAGLASAIFLSSQTLTPDSTASSDGNRSALALGQVTADLRHAMRFSERSASAATFAVPDRNSDGKPETVRYSWSGVLGDPLLYSYNGGAARAIANDVRRYSIAGLTRVMPAEALDFPIASSVTYHSFTEAKVDSNYVVVSTPAGTASGNLLLALVAVNKQHAAKAAAAGGWHRIARAQRSSEVSGTVWWKIAGANEPSSYTFGWPTEEKAYATIMRFSGVDPAAPVNSSAFAEGTSATPTCPTVTTSVANTTIVRLGAFHKDSITTDNARMLGHTTITMDKMASDVSGGAARITLAPVGATGTANFTLNESQRYLTFTVALAPHAAN